VDVVFSLCLRIFNMNSRKKFRKNTKKNKTRNKRGGGPNEDALFAAVEKWQTTRNQINAILDKGANVNARTDKGMTPLHIACDRGDLSMIMALLDRGADVNARNNVQRTPLHYACIVGNMKLAMALVDRGADIHAKDDKNWTPLEIVEGNARKSALRNAAAEYKKKNKPNNANEELFAAVKKKETTAANINAILEKGADVNVRDVHQFTPLHHACSRGNMKIAMTLMDRGVEIDTRDVNQRTPLHAACGNGHMEVAMALVDRGADIDARDEDQRTPLHRACIYGHMDLAMALLDRGADIKANNNEGKTPLDLIKKPEDRKKIEEYAKPKRNFITTKKQWKIYLDDEHAEQFENLNGKYEVEFVDGVIYQGDWKDNNKHGKGKEIHPNGDKYEGIWENDKLKDGKVKKTYDDGNIYEGDWKDDKRHGNGRFVYIDGNFYEGDYKDDNKHGNGKYTWNNGDIYEGDWKDDERHGKGTLTYADGDVYEGDWKDGERHGKGKITHHEGEVYDGDWKNDNFNGNGKMTYEDGTIYEGGWKDGGRHGKGKLIYKGKKPIDVVFETDDENDEYLISGEGTFFNIQLKDNVEYKEFNGKIEDSKGTGSGKRKYADSMYEGDYHNDERHGKGKYTLANGDMYEGDYQDDKMHGKGKYTLANGDVYEGDFQDDEMHGKGKYTFADGSVYQGDFQDGNMHGKGKYTYVNGNMYEGDWKDNMKNGYGVMKYETAKYYPMIPPGSTYDGYWKNDKMHTEDTQLGKLTWAPHDPLKPEYPDRSTPCGLRSFEGQWNNDNPKISREYDDFPMSLENWGNYIWKKGDRILLDRTTAYAYEVHQKGKKMQKKLGPVLDFMKEEQDHAPSSWPISEYLDETPQQFIQSLNAHGEDFLNHLLENEDERRRKSTSLELILNKLSTSDYVRNRDTKRIIAICFYYVLGELKSIEEGVEKVRMAGVKHEPDFQLYYINTFIEDNIAAYNGSNGMSCTQGIFERFFTVLESTLALAVAPGNDSFLGKDEATIQERREKYNKILDLWGRNKPKMEDILASFDAIDDRSMVKDKSQEEKIRIVMGFIKSKYISADQDTSSVEKDFDDYLKAKNIPRDFLFAGDPDYIIGGKRKKTRKYRKKGRKTRRKNKK
jgi:ankyrin repeat protein